MRIAILGGSFNPPHLGHLLIAMQVKTLLAMDEVWLLPCYRLQKGFEKEFASVEDRLQMTTFLESSYIKVSDFEITHNPQSYTIETLEKLENLRPADSFYWITGSDQLDSFQRYYRWEDLVSKQRLIIFPREYILPQLEEKVLECLALDSLPANITILRSAELVLSNISSTRIRQRVKNGHPIDFLVPEKVKEYILAHSLYNVL
jgi:nicotinate-nucleotide adenylyltransferase